MDLHFYSVLPVYVPLKALYNTLTQSANCLLAKCKGKKVVS